VDCEIADYLGKEEFLAKVQGGAFNGRVKAILHEGACSDTMETDGRYMMENNYRYSIALLDFCQREKTQYLYASSASVYGGGSIFKESREFEGPLNVYGYSNSCSTNMCAVCGITARRKSLAFVTSTCTARVNSTRTHGVGGFPLLQPIPGRGSCAPV